MKVLKPVDPHSATFQLLSSIGVNSRQHSVLAENLAHYNAQLEEPVVDHWELLDLSVQRPESEQRWVKKIQREINQPYTDRQAADKIEALDRDLLTLISVKGSKFPDKFYVAGGINKGRFGGNSDLDVYADGLLSDRSLEHLAALPGWSASRTVNPQGQTIGQAVNSPEGVHAQFFTGENLSALAGWYGRRFEVDTEQARQGNSGVAEAVIDGFEKKGLSVQMDDDGLHLSAEGPVDRPREEAGPYPLNFGEGYVIEKVEGREPNLRERLGDWLIGPL